MLVYFKYLGNVKNIVLLKIVGMTVNKKYAIMNFEI